MISKTVILFLFGASVASAQFFPRFGATPYDLSLMPELRTLPSHGCPTGPELAPVICQFMQPNMGLNYKPTLIKPTTYISPLVVEKCDEPKLEIHLPPKKPIVIPEAPILPPITVPKFPVPVIIEKPIAPAVLAEPCEPAIISDMSVVGIPAAPALTGAYLSEAEIKEFDFKPMAIPQPPELSAFVMPELPAIAEQHGAFISEAVVNEIDYKPMVPQAPELPAFVMPELPVRVETPMIAAPCPEDFIMPIPVAPIPEFVKPFAPLPAAPILPPVALPEMPVRVEIPAPVPQMIIKPIEEPCLTEEVVVHQPAPIIAPQPPRFPVYREPLVLAEPCDPALEPVMKIAEPYFVRNSPSFIPAMGSMIPARSIVLTENAMRMSGLRFKSMHNVELRPMRRYL